MLEATHLIVDVFELPVAVRVLCPFAGLAICQQTIAGLAQQRGNSTRTDPDGSEM